MGLGRILLCRCNFIVTHETVTIIRFHTCEEKHPTVIIFRSFSLLNFSDFGTPPTSQKRSMYKNVTIILRHHNLHNQGIYTGFIIKCADVHLFT